MFKIETISSEAILSEDLRKNVQRSRLCQPVGPSGVAQRYQHTCCRNGEHLESRKNELQMKI
jgi:hypothetical protein